MIFPKGSSFTGASDGTSNVYADVADLTITQYTTSGSIYSPTNLGNCPNGLAFLNAGSGLSMSLVQPESGGLGIGNDGLTLVIIAQTSQTHSVTCGSNDSALGGFNGGGCETISFTTKGQSAVLKAFGGYWWTVSLLGCTIG
jgi:hypothetical protein